jgi:hyperosmotically inducible protein
MNVTRTLKLAGGALIVVASINAWSQDTTQSNMAAAPSKSDVRKAHRALSHKVLHALSAGGIDTEDIVVLVKEGNAITLAGGAKDRQQMEKAGEIAKGVQGVTAVENSLTIEYAGR